MDLRGSPQQVFARMPDTIRESMRRAYEAGNQYFEVPVYGDEPTSELDYLRLRMNSGKPLTVTRYRFILREIFGPEGIGKLALVDPVLALEIMGRRVTPKAIFNRLPMTKQGEAVREWKNGNTQFVVQMAEGTTRPAQDGERCYPYIFPLRQVFTSPKLLSEFGSALRGPEPKLAGFHGIKVAVDPAVGPDQAVMVSRDAQGRVLSAARISGFPTELKGEFLDPTKPVQVYETNWPYDVAGTGFDVEPPNNTPRGLLMVAPMDHRLGKWGPL